MRGSDDDIEDFRAPRLVVTEALAAGGRLALSREQASYLVNVLRLGDGDRVLVFNGRDGEWRARIERVGKRDVTLAVGEQTRVQQAGPDLDYLFAPLKRARLDYMVQKATELGARRLKPVITRRTVAERVNLERMRANVVEAAEQCGILAIPEVLEPEPLPRVVEAWDPARRLVLCDEGAPVASPLAALGEVPRGPLALLIGPEGGFAPEERQMLLARPYVVRVSLGPRIMRADTAAVAGLTLLQAVLGDWR